MGIHASIRTSHASSLNPSLHGELLLPGQLLAHDDPGLDHEERPRHEHEGHAHEAQAERPGQVVVLPVGHEVLAISQRAEDDQGDRAQYGCNGNG